MDEAALPHEDHNSKHITLPLCWLWHSWEPWKDKQTGSIVNKGTTLGCYTQQERRCKVCNMLEVRMVQATL